MPRVPRLRRRRLQWLKLLLLLLPVLLVTMVRMVVTGRARESFVRQQRAVMDRYLAGWRRWFDRHAEQDASPDRDD